MDLNAHTWRLFKEHPDGQAVIKLFADASDNMDELDIAFRYNTRLKRYYDNKKDRDGIQEVCYWLWQDVIDIPEHTKPTTVEEAKALYEDVVNRISDYRRTLADMTWLSFLLYYYANDFFFPYLYQYEIAPLLKVCDAFGITLPPMPKKADYAARCAYYWQLCEVMLTYRSENGLAPAELCAFLYEHARHYIEGDFTEMPEPSRAWFIGGAISDIDLKGRLWQGNPDTRKGDILVHYETTPVSAITCVWRSATDGVIDPFFHYYGEIYLRDQMAVPKITLKELKGDAYFAQHPLVRKNLQGVNGYAMSGRDFAELKRLWQSKGFDTQVLPELYAPSLPEDVLQRIEAMTGKKEKGVEELLLIPMLLTPMGLVEGRDYVRQQALQAGRAHEKYEDFAIRYRMEGDEPRADVVIEAKYHIRNTHDFYEAFGQGSSYARLLRARVMCLCDIDGLLIFKDDGGFSRDRYKKVYWQELANSDVFNEVKGMMG